MIDSIAAPFQAVLMQESETPHPKPPSVLILTDGKMGDLAPCRGVAKALGATVDEVSVTPSKLHAMLGTLGRDARFDAGVAALANIPDVILASGRRTLPYLKALKLRWGEATLSVFLKDPRAGAQSADLIWVPTHDGLRGPNVIVTDTSPHSHDAASRQSAGKALEAQLSALPRPWLGVLLGGTTRHVSYGKASIDALTQALTRAAAPAGSLLITPSRRTPDALLEALREAHPSLWIWDGTTPNPYAGMLGACDAFFVTGDSHNMVSEAVAAGRQTMVFRPEGLPGKFTRFLDAMQAQGLISPPGPARFEHSQPALDATPVIARAIQAAWKQKA